MHFIFTLIRALFTNTWCCWGHNYCLSALQNMVNVHQASAGMDVTLVTLVNSPPSQWVFEERDIESEGQKKRSVAHHLIFKLLFL